MQGTTKQDDVFFFSPRLPYGKNMNSRYISNLGCNGGLRHAN